MDLIERLSQHKMLGSVPREELAWLAEHGVLRRLSVGEILSHKGEPVTGVFIVLSGRLALFVDRGAGPQKSVEWREGDVTGMLPFSRLINAPDNSAALEPLELLEVHRDHLREMVRECYTVTSILVHQMVDRAKLFTSNELQNEKMISLGKLSAGLAHELNNPASAIERSVCLLTDSLEDAESSTRALVAAKLSDVQMAAVDATREICLGKRPGPRSPLEQVDREEAINEWLVRHHLDPSLAPMLAETEVTFEALTSLANVVPEQALNAALRWAASDCSIRSLAGEIQGSSARISSLVMAIKGFTQMDQAIVAERIDPGSGLSDAVMVMNAKASERSVAVSIELESALPQVMGIAAELNQIWGILIDNALDATPVGGRVDVSARHEGQHIVVRVIDYGHGIPEKIRSSIFDPFFTTKPMGFGTGLGLDIARRLVRHNNGTIDFESQSERTEFRVLLPVADSSHF